MPVYRQNFLLLSSISRIIDAIKRFSQFKFKLRLTPGTLLTSVFALINNKSFSLFKLKEEKLAYFHQLSLSLEYDFFFLTKLLGS